MDTAIPAGMTLTPREAATALRISRSKVYELLAAGVLPSIRIGASIRVPTAALQAWVERQMAETQAARR